jgi:hypothetical protein
MSAHDELYGHDLDPRSVQVEFTRANSAMMKKTPGSTCLWKIAQHCVAVLCCALLVPGDAIPTTLSHRQATQSDQQEAANLPPDQLDSLVAPIALYPDPLLAQVLAASTYPLELVQLQQWLAKNKDLKDKALADAVQKQPWDASVQAMAALPDVVKRLVDDVQWTTDLGNAFLAQQNDVMDAVQRMRKKAEEKGNLKSNEQMKVETKVVENKQVIVVEQSNPQVVYVPSYDPVVVYGAPAYPYPPIAYPPPGYYAAGMAISFGVGLAMGAAWGGGWGYNTGWHGGNNNITINNNNNYVNNSNRQNVSNKQNVNNRTTQQSNRGGGGSNWQHNPQHRGGTPYGNKATANKYGGTSRGASVSDRQANARQQQSRQQGGGRQQAGTMDRGGAGGGRQQSGASGGSNRVGDRQTSSGGSGGRNSGALGGSSGNGSAARASSSRGSSSMGGGGGRGGGGGGRRR